MTKKASKTRQRTKSINALAESSSAETVITREQTKKNGRGRKKIGRPTQLSQTEKVFRFRYDLLASTGVARQNAKIFREMYSGRLGLEAGDILSRNLSRQREHVMAIEQVDYLRDIDERLKAMQEEQRMRTVSVQDYNTISAGMSVVPEVTK